ncbi:MAG: hypothetical protein M0R21_00140 [Lentimicrobiaceae bacterium]|nr:hypothetical protein [Lentimicrobiaceae bacterium]
MAQKVLQAALLFPNVVKMASKQGVLRAKEVYDNLKHRFSDSKLSEIITNNTETK